MTRLSHALPFLLALAGLLAGAPTRPAHGAPAAVLKIQTQKVADITYFRLRVSAPQDLKLPALALHGAADLGARDLSRLPRLVPQDRKAHSVYLRLAIPGASGRALGCTFEGGLEFVGQLEEETTASFLLL